MIMDVYLPMAEAAATKSRARASFILDGEIFVVGLGRRKRRCLESKRLNKAEFWSTRLKLTLTDLTNCGEKRRIADVDAVLLVVAGPLDVSKLMILRQNQRLFIGGL